MSMSMSMSKMGVAPLLNSMAVLRRLPCPTHLIAPGLPLRGQGRIPTLDAAELRRREMMQAILGLFNISGGEIVLALATLLIVLMVGAVFLGLIFAIVRGARKPGNAPTRGTPPAHGPRPDIYS
jgi:hypothetical protein